MSHKVSVKIEVSGTKFSPLTFAKLPAKGSKKALKFFGRNAMKLAAYLEAKPNSAHDQSTWAEPNSEAPCGTRACALGWAAISGLIPGLQYTLMSGDYFSSTKVFFSAFISEQEFDSIFRDSILTNDYIISYAAIANGKLSSWYEAGEAFFGAFIMDEVFSNGDRSKENTIKALRFIASSYMKGEKVTCARFTKHMGYE